jgi:site-specific recombinase XerD
MPKVSENKLPRLIQEFFCQRLQAQQQASPRTVNAYRDTFRLLLAFVETQTARAPDQQRLEDWDAPRILKFLDYLENERHNEVRSRNARLAALRSFMRFVAQQEPSALAMTSAVLAIPMKRFDRPLLGFLSRPETEVILDTPLLSTWSGRRDRVLFALFYNTGARVSELLAINRQDIQIDRQCVVRLHGKGRKERSIPLWKSTSTLLKSWLAELPADPTTPVFCNRFGQRLSRSGVEKRLRNAVRQAAARCPSLNGRAISPHTFRHTTAMHQLQAEVDITVIALWLGHESPATTHQYIELDLSLKERALQKFTAPNAKTKRFKPTNQLLKFLEQL